jgi:mannosyltransferase OCH1-like enzyme
MMPSNQIIQSLWIGAELSVMERLSLASFLAHGHEYHLYVYEDTKLVPEGTRIKDGNDILPSSMIFQYREFKSYAGFSNFFRYKLLMERGGWWVDTDMVCLQPFEYPADYVFASEVSDGNEVASSAVIKAPANSEAMAYAWQTCQSKDVKNLAWGETGPRLVDEAVRLFSLQEFRQPARAFCPLSYSDWNRVLQPDGVQSFAENTYALHLWNEMWRRAALDKNQEFHPACLYERLKRKYLPH